MDFSDPKQRRVFFEVHANLPRQSAGSKASTLRALDMVAHLLPQGPLIGDMACGPGASALVLAEALPTAQVICVDLHQPFLDELSERMSGTKLAECISIRQGDMIAPMPEAGRFDLIWCEGGIYNVGVGTGLQAWRTLLKPGGVVVFNEPIRLVATTQREDELISFWRAYAQMTDEAGIVQAIAQAGYNLLGGFNLPEDDWWDEYYTPMQARLDALEETYSDNDVANRPLVHSRREIDVRRRFGGCYNYRFFAARLA